MLWDGDQVSKVYLKLFTEIEKKNQLKAFLCRLKNRCPVATGGQRKEKELFR